MWTAAYRSMLAHKLRLLLTTTSIALGVAFLAGTFLLTDTMKVAFEQLFGQVSAGNDAVVRHESAFSQGAGVGVSRSPVDAALVDRVRSVPGVQAAEGTVTGYALLTDTAGKAVLTKGGAPTQGYTLPADTGLRGEVHLRTGRAPSGPAEVAIDATSATQRHIPLGSTISVLFRGPTQRFTVVGTIAYGGAGDLGGTTSAYFDGPTAQRVLGQPGQVDQVDQIIVRSDGHVSDQALAARIAPVLPPGVEAVTGATVAKEGADAVNAEFAFLGVLFSAFAGIALFVGSFIIWNTFTMIVTQRSREIALLRAVGATRRQVQRSLLAEAAVLGVGASAIGLGLGVLVAEGLDRLMRVVGFAVPSTTLQVHARTVWLSLLVGTVVTVVSAYVPSRRATKVLPVEALREAVPGATASRATSRTRAAAGVLLLGGGTAAVLVGLYGSRQSSPVFLGLLAAVLGVITLGPLAARPLAAVLGSPLRARGITGALARENAMRNPRRTASTATALMIGLALVIGMSVFASSLKASLGTILADSTHGDLFVTAAGSQGDGFSPVVADLVAHVPGVAVASATGNGDARFAGSSSAFSSVDPATVDRVLDLDVRTGSATALGTDGVLVAVGVAQQHGWHVGSTVPVEFAATGSHPLTVRGTYAGTGYLTGDYVISRATQAANAPGTLVSSVLVVLADGADRSAVQAAVASALADHQDAKVLTPAQYQHEAGGIVDALLTFVTVMLLLAVGIALLGIVNTLALSVHERTRELGLLRAIGMTRGQVRAVVRWESVVISLIGAVTGAVVGLGIGTALAQSLKGQGVTQIAVPGAQVGLYVVLAAVAGVVAAVGPARSASRVDVLRAVVSD